MKAKLAELDTALYFVVFCPKPRNWFRLIALGLSKSGNGGLYVLVAIACALFLEPLGQQFALTVMVAFVIERPLYFYFKNRFARLRPCDCYAVKALLTPSDKFSLPSGHSAGAWLYATCLIEHLPLATFPLMIWATGVSLSRVIVGVHYPLDVVLGAIMGIACASVAILMLGSL
ncbi:phosphatase PAP2 family protein [Pseudoalteromonas sp. McH1-7]|nr:MULTISPECIES: phosphatase PAP2 family protein [Pseudoalteromonas]MDW7549231.1 phosphatase PAP2 family protein [Pseudoalteromonas peptidolytica]NLR15992.1 phosphatase PAP2 family protein [Pseudoalteromonas peptidolytica]NUZ10557.1 phosphatase PAP2 family protein [Pseudoalteromonas sp. McH1-7]RRS08775.1 phosphatase PAP2 family protein [Pseudoalteromonas sp. J010]RXF00940.1 phosphatase PAP2 family protein [Pseudoalteromonas sp. PS5]